MASASSANWCSRSVVRPRWTSSLARPTATVAAVASSSTRAPASDATASAGTARWTSPQSAARSPLISRPSSSISLARATPTSRGMSQDEPESGVNPIAVNGARNRASSATTAKSDASTRLSPSPITLPVAAVTIGVCVSSMVGMSLWTPPRRCRCVDPTRGFTSGRPRVPRSKPEQKSAPFPVSAITRIASSSPAVVIASIRASTIGSVSEFRRSTRSRRMRRTPPSGSTTRPSALG